jgi:hypothetical protein
MSVNQMFLRRAAVATATLLLVVGVNSAQAAANVTVTFSTTPFTLNPTFLGFSYEKSYLTQNLFRADNTALINCFSQAGDSGILRIGGRSVDLTGWNGEQGTGPIVQADVDRLAGFMNALPSGWKVIYGINCTNNNDTDASAESSYVKNALGSRLLSFEIGNETEQYKMSETSFITLWSSLKSYVKPNGPMEGPDEGGGSTSYTTIFADSQSNSPSSFISLLTQHYYRDTPAHWVNNPTGAMTNLLSPDPNLPGYLSTLVSKAYTDHVPQGFRMDEDNSLSGGGMSGVSDAFGAALWSLDFMGTGARYNCTGVNFHGGSNSPYTPIYDDHTSVTGVGPDLYGMKMFSLLPGGNACNATITTNSGNPSCFSVFGVIANNQVSCILDNKNNSNTITVTVHLGSTVANVNTMSLNDGTGDLYSTTGFVLGGSAIHPDGTWTGTFGSASATAGVLTVTVNSHSALLLIPN